MRARRVACTVLLATCLFLGVGPAKAEERQGPYPMAFPVAGESSFADTFGVPRPGGRIHQGIDIFAPKMTPVLPAAPGWVREMGRGERAGYFVVLEHSGGWRSSYLHLNNDMPGTDDGRGAPFVAGLAQGSAVAAGVAIGYVGDSGNAEQTPPHLHFELRLPDGAVVNPYPYLRAAGPPGALEVVGPVQWSFSVGETLPYTGAPAVALAAISGVLLGAGWLFLRLSAPARIRSPRGAHRMLFRRSGWTGGVRPIRPGAARRR